MACIAPNKFCCDIGIGAGLSTTMMSALYTLFARMGVHQGFTSYDITFLRLLHGWDHHRSRADLSPEAGVERSCKCATPRWELLPAGPLLGLVNFTAIQLAPASHVAIFGLFWGSVMGILLTVAFLPDRLIIRHADVLAIVILGPGILGILCLGQLRAAL